MMVLVLSGKKMGIHFYNLKIKVAELVPEWLLLFGWLNLFILSKLSQQNLVERYALTKIEAMKIFKFGKNNHGYETGADLLK